MEGDGGREGRPGKQEYLQGRGCCGLITEGVMKHNWGLEFQEREKRSQMMITSDQ